jgi:hypothetical protein
MARTPARAALLARRHDAASVLVRPARVGTPLLAMVLEQAGLAAAPSKLLTSRA